MQKPSPLIKDIAQLIDARSKTLEINLKAEIKASENRVRAEVQEVRGEVEEVRTDLQETRVEIQEVKEELKSEIKKKVKNHEERIKALEKHSGLAA